MSQWEYRAIFGGNSSSHAVDKINDLGPDEIRSALGVLLSDVDSASIPQPTDRSAYEAWRVESDNRLVGLRWAEGVGLFARDKRLTPSGLRVAFLLASYMNSKGETFVGMRRLATVARIRVITVRQVLGVLEETGWLLFVRRSRGGHRQTHLLRLVIPAQLDGD